MQTIITWDDHWDTQSNIHLFPVEYRDDLDRDFDKKIESCNALLQLSRISSLPVYSLEKFREIAWKLTIKDVEICLKQDFRTIEQREILEDLLPQSSSISEMILQRIYSLLQRS